QSDGGYTFSNLPLGVYKITISYLGYKTYSEAIDLSTTTNLDVSLNPSVFQMTEVIVATPFHKLQSENVMKVEKIQLEAIKKSGSPTLVEGLQTIPGVNNVSTGVGIGKPVIRGLSYNRVVIYAQHIRLENQQFGDEHGLGLSGNGLESVELIKGPASLLYGSDALGGVLYLNPERYAAPESSQGNLNLDYFTNSRGYSADGAYKGSGEKLKYLFRIGGSSHADYQDGNGSRITNTRFEDRDFKAGLGYQSGKFKTDFRYNFNRSELGLPEEVGLQSTDREPMEPRQELDNHMLSSRSSYFFNRSHLTVTLGYSQNDRKEFEEHEEEVPMVPDEGPEGPALDMKLQTLSYNIHYQLPSNGKLETVIGLQGMRQDNENFGEEVLIPDAITKDIGVMATSHLQIKENDLQVGLRYDNRSIEGEANGAPSEEGYIAPLDVKFNSLNLALGYRTDLSENMIGRLNLASGFRAPNLAELTSNGVHEGTNRYEIGNPDLDNEKNLQLDLSLEYANEHVGITVNGFYNAINDFIYIEPTGTIIDENDVFLYQQQDATLYGGEFGIHFHPHPLDLLHVESTFQTVIGELDDNSDIPLIPANSWLNTVRLESRKKDGGLERGYVFASWRAVFDQERVSFYETPTDGYSVFNIGAGAQLAFIDKDLSLRLSINNVFDKSYIDHLSRLKADGIQNIGRNLHFGMSWIF
ncbi:MAG: TonB-dependent receptor, partial [Eudoraea sp.]|nr:TonB-dependent receptor [Eudoraea sp.]